MVRPADNPFASHRIESLAFEPQGTTWNALLDRLQELRYRACILGEQGSGKTTLLEQLVPRLRDTGFEPQLWLHHGEVPRIAWGRLCSLSRRDVILVDGADLLPRWQWHVLRMLSYRAGGLVVVSHTRRMLDELVTCMTSERLLTELMEKLAPAEDGGDCRASSAELFQTHGGNIREALREAYDRWSCHGSTQRL